VASRGKYAASNAYVVGSYLVFYGAREEDLGDTLKEVKPGEKERRATRVMADDRIIPNPARMERNSVI
jgi:hypothetical protein